MRERFYKVSSARSSCLNKSHELALKRAVMADSPALSCGVASNDFANSWRALLRALVGGLLDKVDGIWYPLDLDDLAC